jgi:hypothetical protein
MFGTRRITAYGIVVTAGLLALTTAGCGGGGSGGGSPVGGGRDVAKLRDSVPTNPTSCPIRYDVTSAANAAGLTGAATPASGSDAVDVGTPRNSSVGSYLNQVNGVDVTCAYLVGGTELKLTVMGQVATSITVPGQGTMTSSAVGGLLPEVQAQAHLTRPELETFAQSAAAARTGTPVLTPNNRLALVRLPVSGPGDAAFLVSVLPASAQTAPSGDDVSKLALTLAKQATW